MYNGDGLVPARFLILTAHFALLTDALWTNTRGCSTGMESRWCESSTGCRTGLVTGLSVAIGLLCFEFLAFILGLTMFNGISALLSIVGHASSTALVAYFILNQWQCGWFWWIFAIGSALPAAYDFCAVFNETTRRGPAGWTPALILAGAATAVGCALPVGYSIGVINSPAAVVKTFCDGAVAGRYGARLGAAGLDALWAAAVAALTAGGAVGGLGGASAADRLGRRGALGVALLLAAAAAGLFEAARPLASVEALVAGRVLMGAACGLITAVMPMYLMELAPTRLQGATGALCPLGITLGVLLGQIISMHNILGSEENWPHCLSFYFLPMLFCCVVLPFLPESPKYLFLVRKQPQLALIHLQRVRGCPGELLTDEMEALKGEESDDDRQNWSVGSVLRNKQLLLPVLLTCSLQAGQQLSGINAVFYYSSAMFEKVGLSREMSELATIGAGVCNAGMAALSLWFLSKFKRRTVLLMSLWTTLACLILLAVSTMLVDTIEWMSFVSIIGVLGFVICYGIGLGPVPYFIGGELFDVGPRSAAMALGSGANWGANFAVGLLFPTMQHLMGASCFLVFAAIVLVLIAFVRVYLPETRGKEPWQVSKLVQDGFKSSPVNGEKA